MEEDWELWVHDTITGEPLEQLDIGESTWATGVSGTADTTETFVLGDDPETEKLWGRVGEVFRPNARMLVRRWGTFVQYAQKIDDWEYDKDTRKVTVSLVELARNEAEWRLVDGVKAPKSSTLTVTNRTASGAVAAAIACMLGFGNPEWSYPFDPPADAPGDFSESWPFWKKFRMSDIFAQIEERMGVEIYFRPYLTAAGWLRFQTRVAPSIMLSTSTFNLQADESPLSGVKYKVDGKRQLTGLLGVGNGSGEDQETAASGKDTDPMPIPMPIRDSRQEFPDLTGAALAAATRNRYLASQRPVVQWSVESFTINKDWSPEHCAPGRVWQLESYGDPVIPNGIHTLRIISVSGGNGRVLKVQVQDAIT